MLEYKTQVYLSLPIIITHGAPFWVSNFPSRLFNIKARVRVPKTRREELFPPLIHFFPSLRLSSLGRGGWLERHAFRTAAAVERVDAGSPASLATARCAQGAPASWSPLPPPATGAEKRSHTTTDAARALLGRREAGSTLPSVKAYLAPGIPTSERSLRSLVVLPSHTLALSFARVPTLRWGCLFFLPLWVRKAPSSPLSHPQPPPAPCSVCSNRTSGSPGCAHLTSGAGVVAQGSAPSSAQRAARSALHHQEHPALTIPNGLFQQPGAEADLQARRKAQVLLLPAPPWRNVRRALCASLRLNFWCAHRPVRSPSLAQGTRSLRHQGTPPYKQFLVFFLGRKPT